VDPRARLDDVEKRKFLTLPGLELLNIYDILFLDSNVDRFYFGGG
jgi:hypothetical protein